MSKDGPKNIDGAEEAKKMIKRRPSCQEAHLGHLPVLARYQIRARALDHAVGERKISSIQDCGTWMPF